MKKPKYPYRIAIIMFLLTVPPIGATQLGWYLHDMQTGFDYGMIVGTFSVIYAVGLFHLSVMVQQDHILDLLLFAFYRILLGFFPIWESVQIADHSEVNPRA